MSDSGAQQVPLEQQVPRDATLEKGTSGAREFVSRLFKEKPLGLIGAVITLTLLLTGIFAGWLAPYGVNQTNPQFFLSPPSSKFWLGTDQLGRDVLTRIIYGARVSVIVGLSSASISTVIAMFIGMVTGYIGGKLDTVVQRFVDALMCIPGLVFLMVVISMVGPGMFSVVVTTGILGGFSSSRIIRSAVMGIKENMYLRASVAIGCSTSRILVKHILPNIMAPIIIIFTLRVPAVILIESSLSFLGYGIPPPTPSWGSMLGARVRPFMMSAPWLVVWPGLALATVVFGTNVFGDALRDLLDPRLRGGLGRFGLQTKARTIHGERTSGHLDMAKEAVAAGPSEVPKELQEEVDQQPSG